MAALPSKIGISFPDTLTKTLSIPSPESAATRCSTVEISILFSDIVEASCVPVTLQLVRLMSRLGTMSIRRNIIPLSGSAGQISVRINFPECNPIPSKPTFRRMVLCLNNSFTLNQLVYEEMLVYPTGPCPQLLAFEFLQQQHFWVSSLLQKHHHHLYSN